MSGEQTDQEMMTKHVVATIRETMETVSMEIGSMEAEPMETQSVADDIVVTEASAADSGRPTRRNCQQGLSYKEPSLRRYGIHAMTC